MVRSFGLVFESNRVSIPAMGSYCLATLMSSDRTKQICLWMTIEKENSEFKPVKLRLKIDPVSYPARAEGLGKYERGWVNMIIVHKYPFLHFSTLFFFTDSLISFSSNRSRQNI